MPPRTGIRHDRGALGPCRWAQDLVRSHMRFCRATRLALIADGKHVNVPASACVIDMARPSTIARHAARTVLLASIVPSVVFYVTLRTGGLSWAIAAALTWYFGVLAARRLRGRPIAGAAMLGAALMTTRAVL